MTVSPAASLIVAYSDLRVVQLVRGAIAPPLDGRGLPVGRFRPTVDPEPRIAARPVIHPEPRFALRPELRPEAVDARAPAVRPPEMPAEPLLPPRFGPLPPPWLMPAADSARHATALAADCVKLPPRVADINDTGRLLDQFV